MPKKIISTPAGAEIAHSHQAWENPYRGPAVKFARHQFHIDPLARNVPQLQCFSHRYTRVFLTVRRRDRKRYYDLFSIVPRTRCTREMHGLGLSCLARRGTVASAGRRLIGQYSASLGTGRRGMVSFASTCGCVYLRTSKSAIRHLLY